MRTYSVKTSFNLWYIFVIQVFCNLVCYTFFFEEKTLSKIAIQLHCQNADCVDQYLSASPLCPKGGNVNFSTMPQHR